jgi:hypothetical protein
MGRFYCNPAATEKQKVFLDRRRQMQQNHDLRKARRGNVTQARELNRKRSALGPSLAVLIGLGLMGKSIQSISDLT